MMEAQTLDYSSPLYGRRTGQIKLKQIPFRHYQDFFPDKSRQELIEYYAVTGGVPKYIEFFYNSKNIYTAIEKNILAPQSALYEEPNFLLQKEVGEIGSYFSIIKTIAAGNHKLAKIAANLEVKQTSLTKYLKTLINLDILEREVPITEENPEKSKRGLYKIKDNFICFWFKFVYPNMGLLELEHVDSVLHKIKKNLIDNHISFVYEDICLEQMWQLNAQGNWGFPFDKVGRWWNNHTEIDIMAFNSEESNIVFGECKYTGKPMDTDIFYALVGKAKEVEWRRNNRHEHYVFFSISGFTEEMKGLANDRNNVLLIG
jgi:AAA+ ATPase superfamily predicted ATPase